MALACWSSGTSGDRLELASRDWLELASGMDRNRNFIRRKKDEWIVQWSLDVVIQEKIDSVMAELDFLSRYLRVFDEYIRAESSSYVIFTGLPFLDRDPEAREIYAFFKKDVERRFGEDTTLVGRVLKVSLLLILPNKGNPFQSKRSKLLEVLTTLNQKCGVLKQKICSAYQKRGGRTVTTLSFQPISSFRWDCRHWRLVCPSLDRCLLYLSSNQKYILLFGDQLMQEIITLRQRLNPINWLLTYRDCQDEHLHGRYGGIFLQVAYLCFLCWYTDPSAIDESMQSRLAISFSDLNNRLDLDAFRFLEIMVKCLGRDPDYPKFICHVLDFTPSKLVTEFVTLLTSVIELIKFRPKDMMHVPRILGAFKDLVLEAIDLNLEEMEKEGKPPIGILLAKTWCLNVEIAAISYGRVLSLSDADVRGNLKFEFSPETILKKEVPALLQCLSQSSASDEENYMEHMKVMIDKSVELTLLVREKATITKLLDDRTLMFLLKHKAALLVDGLGFLVDLVSMKLKENDYLIREDVKLMAAEVSTLSSTLLAYNLEEEEIENMTARLLYLTQRVQHFIATLIGNSQIPTFDLPKTPGVWFVEAHLQNLGNRLRHKLNSSTYVINQIKAICKDLEEKLPVSHDVFEKEKYNLLHTQLVDVAYQAESFFELMLGENNDPQYFLWVYHLFEEIRCIEMQLANFDGNNSPFGDGYHNVPENLKLNVSRISDTRVDDIMVGQKNQKELITNSLIRGTHQRDIVTIVGMPGVGKTTLANNVFHFPSVIYHFHIRSWCCVSQTYKKRDLLLEILSNIVTENEDVHAMSEADLETLLHRKLKQKRYLIVLDDMWSTTAWDDMKLSFPDDFNGSRILITSRLEKELSKISNSHLLLHPLSEEESWELLKLKIFGKGDCPEELLDVGQKIAKNCKGLPLSIGVIGGLLERVNRNQFLWNQIGERVSSLVINDPESQCKKILELSYEHLPDHLRASFLYFVAFPEDKDIPAWKLKLLWIAEGFVRKLESKSFEDVAEDYLMDLVGRSLVIVAKRGSSGKVKSCRVHDVVRDLCLLKCKEDRFLHPISGKDEPYSSLDNFVYGVHYERFSESNCITHGQYRLCFRVKREQFVVSKPSGPFVRTLLLSATTDENPRCSYDISFIFNNFKRLRVLDLESINMGNSWVNGIEFLADLRFLAIYGDMESIPSCLSDLENLETFILKSLKSKVFLPDTIWKMKKLRHLHVATHAIFPTLKSSDQLDSLITLSLMYFPLGEETNKIIMKFPNLQKLKCIYSEPTDAFKSSCLVPAWGLLCKLESLSISYLGKALNGGDLNLPSNLKKLTLSNFHLSMDHMTEIGKLQKLEGLKLISCAFEGSRWEMTEGEFLQLEYLELDNLNIGDWEAYDDHLPVLQQLVVRNCKQLKEVPIDIGRIPTLKKIEVQLCGSSVIESIKNIEEEEIEGLQIVINSSEKA